VGPGVSERRGGGGGGVPLREFAGVGRFRGWAGFGPMAFYFFSFFLFLFQISISFISFAKQLQMSPNKFLIFFLKFKASFQDSKKQVFQMKQDFSRKLYEFSKRALLA
jgi:hypothetical protein